MLFVMFLHYKVGLLALFCTFENILFKKEIFCNVIASAAHGFALYPPCFARNSTSLKTTFDVHSRGGHLVCKNTGRCC